MVNNENPKASIILPTYNRAYCLPRAIKSVLCQTYKNFELIIVDDGSKDNTKEVVENFDDTRIKYIKCDKNKGVSTARNIGIIASKGEYISFQDSDDEMLPQKMEILIGYLESCSAEYGVVYSGYWIFWPDKKEYRPKNEKAKSGNIYSDILGGCYFSPETMLLKKECFTSAGLFDESLPCLEDWDFIIRVSKYFQFYYINESLLNVFPASSGVSSNFKNRLIAIEMIYNKYCGELKNNKRSFSNFSYGIGADLCHIGEIKKGRKYIFKAVKLYPYSKKHVFTAIASLFGQNIYNKIRATYDSFIK